jgi:hypothetical protein
MGRQHVWRDSGFSSSTNEKEESSSDGNIQNNRLRHLSGKSPTT